MTYEALAAGQSQWLDLILPKLADKMAFARERAKGLAFIPYTTEGKSWQPGPIDGICWWTNGFWPGLMWQMYLQTGDAAYRAEAEHAEEMLDAAFADYDHLHHDVGFMWLLSAGANYRLTGADASRKRAQLAANLLAGRYNPNGFIRAWNTDRVGWAIIDCMMNLALLYWAADYVQDPRFRQIAMRHADTVLAHFVRPDGSVEHIVVFDPETGDVVEKLGGQGYAQGSSWSRGQAWALYGFVISYIHTGKADYLDAAKRIAHYVISCVGEDGIPDCDFRAPAEPVCKDACAGAIIASGLLELSRHVPDDQRRLYFDPAVRMLRALADKSADWTEDTPALLMNCTGAYHSKEVHIPMVYADYFFVEAVEKLRAPEQSLFW